LAGKILAGATENHELCEALFSESESRGLVVLKKMLFVTDRGKGIISALRDRVGSGLIYQRCTTHKDRNIQRHLAKRRRREAHRRFRAALEQNSYADAKRMLKDLEQWLRQLNESAADSLKETLEEMLPLHSINPIESMFATVREWKGTSSGIVGVGWLRDGWERCCFTASRDSRGSRDMRPSRPW
jgi:putative transposase